MAKKDIEINQENNTTNTIDVDLSAIEKKRIRINGDNTKVIYLNLSDLNIVSRLNSAFPKLKELELELAEFEDTEDEEDTGKTVIAFSEKLSSVDKKMREYVDYIFDSTVSEVCAGNGSMYDPFEGRMRYEYIIDSLSKLYENSLNKEFNQMSARVSKHTSKYHK